MTSLDNLGERGDFGLEREVHKRRKASRCQRSNVSGLTRTNAWRQWANIADNATSSTRSDERNCGFFTRRAATMSC